MTGEAGTTRRPLVTASRRATAYAIAAVALFGFVAMAMWLGDRDDGARLDRRLSTWLYAHIGSDEAGLLLQLSEPWVSFSVAAAAALGAFSVRRWDVALFAAAVPSATVFLGSVVLKPVIGRRFGVVQELYGTPPTGYAFPSGHEAVLAGSAAVVCLLLLSSPARAWVRAAGVAFAVVWAVLGAAGLVRNQYHYATDTVGSMLLAVVVAVVSAFVVDAVLRPRSVTRRRRRERAVSSPAARSPSRTPPAA